MKKWIEAQADRNFASQNSEILRCIQERMDKTAALDARRKAAAGEVSEAKTPAVVPKTGARQGANQFTQA